MQSVVCPCPGSECCTDEAAVEDSGTAVLVTATAVLTFEFLGSVP